MGGIFRYDGPLMKMLSRIANLMLLSVCWALCCVPIVTIIPSCCALYHAVAKVVRGDGHGVTRDFFMAFKSEIKQGLILSLIVLASGAVLFFTLSFGYQMRAYGWGLAYLMIGILILVFWISTVIFVAPVLSRFKGNIGLLLRLALYFSMENPLKTFLMAVLLVVMAVVAYFYVPLMILLPGLYVDLIAGMMEKSFDRFTATHGKKAEETEDEADAAKEAESEDQDTSEAETEEETVEGDALLLDAAMQEEKEESHD